MASETAQARRLPTLAIVGRPNVGKSTLFNRLTGKRLALVDDRPGVTRDRREGDARIGGLKFRIVDTAGLEDAGPETLARRMTEQSREAIQQADVCLFMIDGRAGVTPSDEHFAELVRKTGKPVIVAANKAEGGKGESGRLESYSLGLGDPVAISAEHGEGLGDLHDALEEAFRLHGPAAEETDFDDEADGFDDVIAFDPDDEDAGDGLAPDRPLRLAIVGRPNAGKSTLINRLVGEERMLTGPEAGITRDAIGIDWEWNGQRIKLWDTAGMRKKARVNDKLEKMSVSDGLRAIKFAEVVVLLIDATQPLEKQDLQLASLMAREGRAMVLAINKWDMIEEKDALRREIELEVTRLLPQVSGIAVVTFSGLSGRGVHKLMPAVMETYKLWNMRIPTNRLNGWLEEQIQRHPPPAPGGRRIRLRYMTQVNARPPTFVAFCSNASNMPESYNRYLINGLREDFGLWGVPVRINLREGKNPYAHKAKKQR
ncbi:ribosome biogenesis GTPase Der [Anderseniella sp. Alg231-50]|uniref:ribosome biogenesis GTPase Der n=1 Tax=Anderseniella sp. Alg231-50 TaxID=1922226 RepID=UPI000D55769F